MLIFVPRPAYAKGRGPRYVAFSHNPKRKRTAAGIEARSGETEGLDPKDESPARRRRGRPMTAAQPQPEFIMSNDKPQPCMNNKLIEEIARLIDPDAWHEKLPEDGLAMWWIDRRHKARAKAQAAYSVMEKRLGELEEALREALIEARLQLEYLDGKFKPTGTTAAMLAKIDAALNNESKPVENG